MSRPENKAIIQYDADFQQRAAAATGIAQRVSARFKMPAIMASLFVLAMSLEPGEGETQDDVEKAVDGIASDCHRRAKEAVGIVPPKGSLAVAQWQNEIADLHQAYVAIEAEKVRQDRLERLSAQQEVHVEALSALSALADAAPPPAAQGDDKPKAERSRKAKPPKETDSPAEPVEAAAE